MNSACIPSESGEKKYELRHTKPEAGVVCELNIKDKQAISLKGHDVPQA